MSSNCGIRQCLLGTCCLAVFASSPAFSEEDPFAALDKMLEDNFETIDRSLEEQFQLLDEAMEDAYQRLGEEVEKEWGATEVELPTKKAWVDYTNDLKTRRVFDFESGTLRLERIIDMSEGTDEVIRDMIDASASATTDTAADLAGKDLALSYARESLADEGIDLAAEVRDGGTPVLEGIAEPPPAGVVDQAVREVLGGGRASAQIEIPSAERPAPPLRASVATLANNRKKVSIQVPFKPGYENSLANRYLEEIAVHAEKQQLPPSLLLAVMETESSFNPRATSPVPAYGLMQLVPRSGALDAYLHVYGEKVILEPDYLYGPERNVELGSAYLNLLHNRYLRHITNDENRELCAIAAYNTGAGNVARSFVGTNNVREAAKVINEMSPEEVYNHLRTELPYEETRNYIRKVTQAQKKFVAYDGVKQ